ncbi:unnamed protein product [Orchesella dallaii]|uniref:Gamma-aminobutyric acid receptor subunit beta n=1 Tax=Orchesella dallaii TaxID=48710 RepID=A0ABP1RYI0_9HEXA
MRFKVETRWRLNIPISVLLSLTLNCSIVQSINTNDFKRFYFGNLSVDLTGELGDLSNDDYLPPQSPENGVSQKSYGNQSPSHNYHTANHHPQRDQPQKNRSSDPPPPTTPRNTNQPYMQQDLKTLSKNITNILNSLGISYDKHVRPNSGGEAVEVGITMFVLGISAVNEVEMDFTFDFYFRQFWKDNRLTFQGPKGVNTLSMSSEFLKSMWVPDTFFPNEKTSYFHTATIKNEFVRISQTGDILRSMRLTVCASCPMDLRHFPMDSQLCTIEIESFGYSMSDIRYKWAAGPGSVGISWDLSLPQFKVHGYRQKTHEISLSTGNYSRLACEIQFVRSMGYYLIQVYIPSCLIVVISWVSFWVNRNATPARVYLGITTVLTMTTLMSSTNRALPKISYVKSIDVYLGVCFVMVFAALLEYATIGYLTKRIRMRKNHFAALQKMALPLQKSCESCKEHVQKQYYPTIPQTPAPQAPPQQQQPHASHSTPRAGSSRAHIPTTLHQQQHAHSTLQDFHETPRFVESSTVAPYYSTQQQAGSVTQHGGARNYDHGCDPRYYDTKVYNPGNPIQYYGGAPPPPHTQAAPSYTKNTSAQELSGCSRAASVKRRNLQPEVESAAPHYAPQQTQQPSSSIEITPGPGGDKTPQLIPINPNQICGITPSDIDKYSRVVFPVCFVCFNLLYWIIYLYISKVNVTDDLVILDSEG